MVDNDAVRNRLREFGNRKYASLAEFARALKMTPQALNVYLIGRSLPGSAVQKKLHMLGCDLNWLMTGKTSNPNPAIIKDMQIEVDLKGVAEYELISNKQLDIKKLAQKLDITTKELENHIFGHTPFPLGLLIKVCEITKDLSLLEHAFRNTRIKVQWKGEKTGK